MLVGGTHHPPWLTGWLAGELENGLLTILSQAATLAGTGTLVVTAIWKVAAYAIVFLRGADRGNE